jgi:signal transduction histidine kinase
LSYPVSSERINLKPFLLKFLEPFYSRSSDRQQTLEVHLPDELPNFSTDKAALERILAELLNNACKYTPPGGKLILTVEWTELSAGTPPAILITVLNEAEVPTTELSRIFEKFYRVPNSDPWKQGGTGLGLALVQRLINQLGGTIQVKSQDGWTTFTVSLPSTHDLELT